MSAKYRDMFFAEDRELKNAVFSSLTPPMAAGRSMTDHSVAPPRTFQ
jgi:hypothetical protein